MTDRAAVSEAIDWVQDLATNDPGEIERPTTVVEVLHRFVYLRLRYLARHSDSFVVADYLSDWYVRAELQGEIENRLEERTTSTFLENVTWILALLENEEEVERMVLASELLL